jgi:23S rRNA (uridine2552-2'-O)-methyltransferase
MSYKPNDHYARKAKQENFAARSVYKLEEIDQRFKVIHSGDYVLDLGASPGSWSQYASKKTGEKGRILGVDLKPVTVKLPNAVFIVADLNELDMEEVLKKHAAFFNFPATTIQPFNNSNNQLLFNCVISDMAPNTTGNKFVDQARSFHLCMQALATANKFLKPNGNFVCKIFEGEDAMTFRDELKKHFNEVHLLRPKSTQSSSKEMFMVGIKKRN